MIHGSITRPLGEFQKYVTSVGEGDLTLNSDDLRVTEATGQVRVTTHSKDVDLSQIYGDTYVQDRDGRDGCL